MEGSLIPSAVITFGFFLSSHSCDILIERSRSSRGTTLETEHLLEILKTDAIQ